MVKTNYFFLLNNTILLIQSQWYTARDICNLTASGVPTIFSMIVAVD